jgi:CRISPR-associated protein Cas1
VVAKGGYTSWEVLSWLRGIGASLLVLDRSGRILATSSDRATGTPALVRAQVTAAGSEVGLEIVKALLHAKLTGQAANVERFRPEEADALSEIAAAQVRLDAATTLAQALTSEARAANAYWRALSGLRLTFARDDLMKIPDRWDTAGDRHSALSSSPKKAVTPFHAITNFAYQLAEFEAQLALCALGLDPQLGWAHVDAPYRASAALDLLEAIRPAADAFIAELITTRTFSRMDFIELPTGQVRLAPALAKALSESMLPLFERAVARPAEHLATKIGASAVSPVRVRTRLTNADRKRGRIGQGTKRALKISPACKSCGAVLDNQERTFCSDCLPEFNRERTRKLKHAAKETLADMRASSHDPAQSEEARRKTDREGA